MIGLFALNLPKLSPSWSWYAKPIFETKFAKICSHVQKWPKTYNIASFSEVKSKLLIQLVNLAASARKT